MVGIQPRGVLTADAKPAQTLLGRLSAQPSAVLQPLLLKPAQCWSCLGWVQDARKRGRLSFVLVGSAGAAALLVAVVPQDTTVWPGDRNQLPAPGGDGKSVSLPALVSVSVPVG